MSTEKYIIEEGEEIEPAKADKPVEVLATESSDIAELNAKLDALLKANGIDPTSIG